MKGNWTHPRYRWYVMKRYILLDKNGNKYESEKPGKLGGYSRKKIYGKLDCPSALRHIANGNYVKYRVFFVDEETAIAAGYRPCGICMKDAYKRWKEDKDTIWKKSK